MTKINRTQILEQAKTLYAKSGFEDFSMRKLAEHVGISHSVLYHYYSSEEDILKAMFDHTNRGLGEKRKALSKVSSSSELLKQRISFQIDNAEDVVAVLKYYFSHRTDFEQHDHGFVPEKSTLHMEEVLEAGTASGEFECNNIKDDALVMTHAVNGFLLEYYPHTPVGEEREKLELRVYDFLIRALKGGETR